MLPAPPQQFSLAAVFRLMLGLCLFFALFQARSPAAMLCLWALLTIYYAAHGSRVALIVHSLGPAYAMGFVVSVWLLGAVFHASADGKRPFAEVIPRLFGTACYAGSVTSFPIYLAGLLFSFARSIRTLPDQYRRVARR